MPTRFEAYRMRDGVTPLAEDYFNPMLADIDARIAQLEDRRADLQRVIDDLTAFGLQRIDTLLGPVLASLNQELSDSRASLNQALASLNQELSDSLASLNQALADALASLNQALADALAQRDALIAAVGNVANLVTQAQLASAIQAEQAERQAMDQQLLALIVAAL